MWSLFGANPPPYYKIGDKPSLAIMYKFKRNFELSVQKFRLKILKWVIHFWGNSTPHSNIADISDNCE